jgi:hypothetical protein
MEAIDILVLLSLCYKVFYTAKKEEVKIKSRSKCKIGGEGTFNTFPSCGFEGKFFENI